MIRRDLFTAMERWWEENPGVLESLSSLERQLVEFAFGLDDNLPRYSLEKLARRDGSSPERVLDRLADITKRADQLNRKRQVQDEIWSAEQITAEPEPEQIAPRQTAGESTGKLRELGLERHICNTLARSRHGILAIKDVKALSDEELEQIPGIGPASMRQIRLALEIHDTRAAAQLSAR